MNYQKHYRQGDVNTVKEWIQQVFDERFTPREILYDGLKNGMSVIGEKFKKMKHSRAWGINSSKDFEYRYENIKTQIN